MIIISNPEETRATIKAKKAEVQSAIKKKNTLKRKRVNQKLARGKRKEKLKETSIAQTGMYIAPVARRPKTVDDDALISAITTIAIPGSSADERRRIEIINTCKNLDDLVKNLQSLGYTLKRNSIYLRLLPRRKDSIEGQRHKKVANVKLCRAPNNQRAKNQDRWFAGTTMKHVEDLAVLMGKDVAILGKDDKSHIPMGIPAANK